MLYAILLFTFIAFVFLCPKYRWILPGKMKSKTKEENICTLFGKYMARIVIIMCLLLVAEYFCVGCSYIIAITLFLAASINFALSLNLE